MTLTSRPLWGTLQVAYAVIHVDRDEPLFFVRRNEKESVVHSQGVGDSRANELIERHPGRALDHAAEYVDVVAVDPFLAGLRHERQRGKTLHRRANGLVLVGSVPTPSRRRTKRFRGVQRGDNRIGAVGDAGGLS